MLHRLLSRILKDEPGRSVVESRGRFWSAAEMDDSACYLAANLMNAGVEEMDRVAVLLPNLPEAVLAYLACFKGKFVIVPLDYRHRAPQIGYSIGHSGAQIMIVHHDRLAELKDAGVLDEVGTVLVVGGEPPDRRLQRFNDFLIPIQAEFLPQEFADDELCVMIYTSGTTSRPKGVTLTRHALMTGIKKYLARVWISKDDVALVAGPIMRPMALRSQLLPVLYAGGCVSLLERFTPDAYIDALLRPPAKTFLAMMPSGLGQVLAHPRIRDCDFGSLRLCIVGGDRVPPRIRKAFFEITGVSVTEQCGASEVGVYAVNPPFGRKKPGSIGLPMYGAQVCVVDGRGEDVENGETGEILVHSPTMMDGYWNDTALTRKTLFNGQIRTGDLGRYDEDGFLWFMGRKRDLIVRAGCNVSPLEVENVLLEHPAVAEACVIGVLDPEMGQMVYAFVVLEAGKEVSATELRTFVGERLAEVMVPEKIRFADRLPIKGPGKVDRDLLKMRAQIVPLMETVPFFENAGEEFIRDVVPLLECIQFDCGEFIFRKGEVGDAMYFLTHGSVEVVSGIGKGRLALLSEGAYFGEFAILKERPRTASVRVVEECEAYQLKSSDVVELAQKHPEFGRHIEEALANYVETGLEEDP